MSLLVQKFGGTSVSTPERIREVADHVARCRRRGDEIALVVSAMGKETDDLLYMAKQVSSKRPGREMDMLITAGERKAVALVCMALADLGVPAQSFTGSQAGFLTDTNHQNARILEINPTRIKQALTEGAVPVVAGSQGVSTDKNVTFLGRGGSDTTAVALAQALDATMCELYTDVSGVYSADPRLVAKASKMETVTFQELLEMTAAGCPKPALRSVEFAYSHNVTLHIRSAFTWESGTMVVREDQEMEKAIVKAVTHETSKAKVTVIGVPDKPGLSASLFGKVSEMGLNVDVIVQNVSADGLTDVSFTIPSEQIDLAKTSLDATYLASIEADSIAVTPSVGVVTLVGAGMKSNPGVAAKMFGALGDENINIDMISTSPIRISCVIEPSKAEQAVQLLHTTFGLDY